MHRLFVAVLTTVLCVGSSWGITRTTNGSQPSVQTALDAAADGDTVSIPAGTFEWSTGVGWVNKNIKVLGAGAGQTMLIGDSATFFYIRTDSGYGNWRLSGITFGGTTRAGVTRISVKNYYNAASKGWRIDHLEFSPSAPGASQRPVFIYGVTWGLIDHVNFNTAGIMVDHYAYSEEEYSQGHESGWADHQYPLDLGGPNAVYIEDCTLTFDPTEYLSFGNDIWAGGRQVWRYNTIVNGTFQSHSARNNMRGAISFEFYSNKMTTTRPGWWRYGQMRSGTVIVFNNTFSGFQAPTFNLDAARVCDSASAGFAQCDGTSPWDGNLGSGADAGWPCLDMPGRDGTGTPGHQTTFPSYAWNNGPDNGCSQGGTCTNQANVLSPGGDFQRCATGVPYAPHVADYMKTTPHANGDIDFCQGATKPTGCGNHTFIYTPYTYPHPLAVDGNTGIRTTVKRLSGNFRPLQVLSDPFRRSVTIKLNGNDSRQRSIKVYNLHGREVADLSASVTAKSEVQWNAENLANGVYLIRAGISGQVYTARMLWQK